jgi:hypothetical protein
MLTKLITFPVSGPFSLTAWIVRTLVDRAEAELYDPARIHKELAELEMRQELGEIGEEEYERL